MEQHSHHPTNSGHPPLPGPPYQIGADGLSITCGICHHTSYNLNDVHERYCHFCKVFLDDAATIEILNRERLLLADLRHSAARWEIVYSVFLYSGTGFLFSGVVQTIFLGPAKGWFLVLYGALSVLGGLILQRRGRQWVKRIEKTITGWRTGT